MLDRRRFEVLTGAGGPAGLLAALDAYRNPDGGYGWGLEPDLRDSTSQFGPALHAFEAMADAGSGGERAVALCDWLESVTLPDGGVPFALPVRSAAGCAPFWAEADPKTSSLQITAAVLGPALRLARLDPGVRSHRWLERASSYVVDRATRANHALELRFVLQVLDGLADDRPEILPLLRAVGSVIPPDGVVHVAGGLPDEVMRPIDFAPLPDRPVRELFRSEVVAADLDRLAGRQQDDGGWPEEFRAYSPAAALEWRGYLTVYAVSVLIANGRTTR